MNIYYTSVPVRGYGRIRIRGLGWIGVFKERHIPKGMSGKGHIPAIKYLRL